MTFDEVVPQSGGGNQKTRQPYSGMAESDLASVFLKNSVGSNLKNFNESISDHTAWRQKQLLDLREQVKREKSNYTEEDLAKLMKDKILRIEKKHLAVEHTGDIGNFKNQEDITTGELHVETYNDIEIVDDTEFQTVNLLGGVQNAIYDHVRENRRPRMEALTYAVNEKTFIDIGVNDGAEFKHLLGENERMLVALKTRAITGLDNTGEFKSDSLTQKPGWMILTQEDLEYTTSTTVSVKDENGKEKSQEEEQLKSKKLHKILLIAVFEEGDASASDKVTVLGDVAASLDTHLNVKATQAVVTDIIWVEEELNNITFGAVSKAEYDWMEHIGKPEQRLKKGCCADCADCCRANCCSADCCSFDCCSSDCCNGCTFWGCLEWLFCCGCECCKKKKGEWGTPFEMEHQEKWILGSEDLTTTELMTNPVMIDEWRCAKHEMNASHMNVKKLGLTTLDGKQRTAYLHEDTDTSQAFRLVSTLDSLFRSLKANFTKSRVGEARAKSGGFLW